MEVVDLLVLHIGSRECCVPKQGYTSGGQMAILMLRSMGMNVLAMLGHTDMFPIPRLVPTPRGRFVSSWVCDWPISTGLAGARDKVAWVLRWMSGIQQVFGCCEAH